MQFSKFSLENKINKALVNDNFFKSLCALIFAISILIRSIADIGPDSSVYLDVGKKIAEGKSYFKDIFEINFPILMWLYALEFKLSKLVNISPIIIAELIVNIGALTSIYFSSKILKKNLLVVPSIIDKNIYKIIILSFYLSFFLRPYSLHLFEFGTKTSYFLILFFPYFSYCLLNQNTLTTKHLVFKGFLMALIASLKPHYIFFILIVEFYLALKYRRIILLIAIDKLIAIALYFLYIILIIKKAPLFLDFVVPMWSSYFKTYANLDKLLTNIYSNMAFVIFPYLAVFLVFSRIKMQEIDRIFLAIFIASATVILLENIFTIDQFSLFCALNLAFMLRILQIIIRNNFLNFSDNLFFLGFFLIIPFSQIEFIRISIFGYSGVFNLWWLMIIYNFIFLYKKIDISERQKIFTPKKITLFIIIYLLCFALTVYGFRGSNYWLSNFIGLVSFFVFYFITEKYFLYKVYTQLTRFSIFIVMASLFLYFHDYGDSMRNLYSDEGFRNKFRKIYDFKAYYYKKFAPQTNHHEIDFFSLHQLPHPLVSYFKKDMPQKMSIFSMNANNSRKAMLFNNKDAGSSLVYGYMIDDVKKMLTDKNTKLIFVDYFKINENESSKCIVGYLEYLFLDKEIRKLFLQNYRFENRLILTKNYQISDDFLTKLFDNSVDNNKYKIMGNFQKIITDIEVYVRKN